MKYKALGAAMVGVMTGYALVFIPVMAQGVPTLTCSPGSAAVHVGETAVFTASGGTGSYAWTGQNLIVTNATGSQFSVSYPSTGTFAITVTSGSQSATCNVVVSAAVGLQCAPLAQRVVVGGTAVFSATGGTGSYTWSGDGLIVANPTGSGFQSSYSSPGTYAVRVASGSDVATCVINVDPAGVVVIPGLPNTGFGGSAE